MALDLFSLQQIKFNGSYYAGIMGQAADYGRQIVARPSDGIVQQAFRTIPRLAPKASWQTRACKSWLDQLTDSLDAPMKALNGTTGIVLVGAQAANSNSGYAAGTVHEALTALNGLLCATGFSWSGPDDALTMSMAALLTSTDGTAPALTPSQVALPTQPTPLQEYDLTSVTIAGTAVDGVEGLQLSIDPKPSQQWNQFAIYPQRVRCAGLNNPIEVSLRFGCKDLALARTIGALGNVGQVVATFTAFQNNLAARGTSTIVFTLNNCLVHHPSPHNAQQGRPVDFQIECLPRYDGTNRMLTWATT